jgi:nitroreductase
MTKFENRQSTYPIDELLLSRVSSRAFSLERLTEEQLMSLFEAARWAPSSYNSQPWRFIYARKGDKEWDILFDALVEFNKSWCKDADTLVLVVSRKFFEMNDKLSRTASFDAGAAWMSLALEAHENNIVAHAMSGFDYDKLQKELSIPDTYILEAMIAIGKKGSKDHLSSELKAMEKPSERKPLNEIISKGTFSFKG